MTEIDSGIFSFLYRLSPVGSWTFLQRSRFWENLAVMVLKNVATLKVCWFNVSRSSFFVCGPLGAPRKHRPCGSVVEHALGKGEIVSSILTMGSSSSLTKAIGGGTSMSSANCLYYSHLFKFRGKFGLEILAAFENWKNLILKIRKKLNWKTELKDW